MVDNADVNRVRFRRGKRFEGHRSDTTAEQLGNETRDGDAVVGQLGKPRR